jgi:3-carboxy-cis,cis-muconate cycloisomerase
VNERSDVLIDALSSVPELAAVFSDGAVLAAMLRFEIALARVEAKRGIIPAAAADAIASLTPDSLDATAIAAGARASATPAVPFVTALIASLDRTGNSASSYVHRGATSQDVTDTALVLCLLQARPLLDGWHARIAAALRRLSDEHAGTIMLARTLLQPAAPTTFGLKAAGWLGSLSRSQAALSDAFDRACVLQFGGTVGTLAAFGGDGLGVAGDLAHALDLPLPDAPWHVHRDRLASLVAACGVYAGAIAKTARDVALLMQAEVNEASEPGGGSSAMPHKRNPAQCAAAITSASRLPGLVATFLAGMAHEHERGLAGSPAEWTTISQAVIATGSAASALADALETLHVDAVRMRDAIDATHGTVLAERAMLLLAPALGREAAARAIREALASGSDFVSALLGNADVAAAIAPEDRRTLGNPDTYLGMAEQFRRRLIAGARE